jgi:hypothetical protein
MNKCERAWMREKFVGGSARWDWVVRVWMREKLEVVVLDGIGWYGCGNQEVMRYCRVVAGGRVGWIRRKRGNTIISQWPMQIVPISVIATTVADRLVSYHALTDVAPSCVGPFGGSTDQSWFVPLDGFGGVGERVQPPVVFPHALRIRTK